MTVVPIRVIHNVEPCLFYIMMFVALSTPNLGLVIVQDVTTSDTMHAPGALNICHTTQE